MAGRARASADFPLSHSAAEERCGYLILREGNSPWLRAVEIETGDRPGPRPATKEDDMSPSVRMLSAALIVVTGASGLASGAYAAAHKGGGDTSATESKAARDTNPA